MPPTGDVFVTVNEYRSPTNEKFEMVAVTPVPEIPERLIELAWALPAEAEQIARAPVTRTNVGGEPIPPGYLHLSVRGEGPSGTTTDTYLIGTIGGIVGGSIDRSGNRIPAPSVHFETTWCGDTLTFLTRRDGPDGPHTGDWSERSESWSLASAALTARTTTATATQPTALRSPSHSTEPPAG
jgi:hypothetical protein